MIIHGLQWDDNNLEHIIVGHRIQPVEVEDICFGRHYAISAKYSRKALYGQAESGRYLMIILERLNDAVYRPITARNMTVAERRKYKEIMG